MEGEHLRFCWMRLYYARQLQTSLCRIVRYVCILLLLDNKTQYFSECSHFESMYSHFAHEF